jgi:uncharacterized protein YjbJ (UPF0337 family)
MYEFMFFIEQIRIFFRDAGVFSSVDICSGNHSMKIPVNGRSYMNQDIVKGKWKQIRGRAKEWWGKLTEDDLDVIDGSRYQLIGKLQERYGFSKERAANELNHRLNELGHENQNRPQV